MKRLVLIITMIVFIAVFMINVTTARYVKTEKITLDIEMSSSFEPAAGNDSTVSSNSSSSTLEESQPTASSPALTSAQSESTEPTTTAN